MTSSAVLTQRIPQLDGGYHVPFAHKSLLENLTMDTYRRELLGRNSVQTCAAADSENAGELSRLGGTSLYVYQHPNLMWNRYGPWLDTNLVIPVSPSECIVYFDYFLDLEVELHATQPFLPHTLCWHQAVGLTEGSQELEDYVSASLKASDQVQQEDTQLCQWVQAGMGSSAFDKGRYVPQLELLMHHFHKILSQETRPAEP